MEKKIKEHMSNIGMKLFLQLHKHEKKIEKFFDLNRGFIYGLIGSLVLISLIDCAEAVTVESLKAPIQDLRKEVFGGWMFVVKMISIVFGAIMVIVKQSIVPFGIGAGGAAGIHFGDKWLGDGSAALI